MRTVAVVLILLARHICEVVATKDVASSYFPSVTSAEKATYQSWLDEKFGSSYSQHSFLTSSSEDSGVAVFWEIKEEEEEDDTIEFAIAARASGWLAFGISEVGGMFGSDVVYWESSNPNTIVDSHIVAERAAPKVDECQNWDLIASTFQEGWIILEVKRPLDTGDLQDRVLHNDKELWMAPTKLIAAWGDESSLGYHFQNKARRSVRLFAKDDSGGIKSTLQASLEASADGSFNITQTYVTGSTYEIPARDTDYHDICLTYDDIKKQSGTTTVPLTLIGAIPMIAEESRPFVHHFTVYIQQGCGFDLQGRSMIYVWGPGHEGLALPDNVGFPLFETDERQAIWIQIHYNNPSRVSGVMDSSGVRFYYTETAREEEAGILELGDPLVMLEGTPISTGLSTHEFNCPGSCSDLFLTQKPVTVIAETLHMHQTGVRMTNEVIRNGEVVHGSHVDVFDFDEQGGFHVPQEPFTVMPGDAFRTSCYYGQEEKGEFGLSSQDEMCIAYLLYYPAVSNFGFTWGCPFGLGFPMCSQEYKDRDLSSETELDREFGSSGSFCPATPSTPSAPITSGSGPTLDPTLSPALSPIGTLIPNPTAASPPPTAIPTKNSPPTNIQDTPTRADGDTTTGPPTKDVDSAIGNTHVGMLLWISTVLCVSCWL